VLAVHPSQATLRLLRQRTNATIRVSGLSG
jgi:hypothetical protein